MLTEVQKAIASTLLDGRLHDVDELSRKVSLGFWTENGVRVQLSRMRPKLKRLGLGVVHSDGVYHIVALDPRRACVLLSSFVAAADMRAKLLHRLLGMELCLEPRCGNSCCVELSHVVG